MSAFDDIIKDIEEYSRRTLKAEQERDALDDSCRHPSCIPEFDEEAAKGLEADDVRKRWPRPRFWGVCPDCGVETIAYANSMHYICGDW